MFNNRKLEIRLAKDSSPKAIESADSVSEIDPELISKLVEENLEHVAVLAVASVGGLLILKTLCKIAENLSNPANWR